MDDTTPPTRTISGVPLATLWEPTATWADLCEEVDTLVYVEEYLPAGGTRSFEDWRTSPPAWWMTLHHPTDPLIRPWPGEHVRPVGGGRL